MIHEMGIHQEYFEAIKAGERMVEVRLNDCSKQKIKVGDRIEFINFPRQDETLRVQVVEIKRFARFCDLYQDIPVQHFTTQDLDIKDLLNETHEIYHPELEKQWGVLAISFTQKKN